MLRLAIAAGVGFLTGDDVEVLEAAFSSSTGLAFHAWDIRNLLVPRLLISPLLTLAGAAGVDDPFWLVRIAALPSVALTTCNGWLVFVLARRLTDRGTAVLAAGIFSFHWLPLAYGGTVYPRTVSTACVLLAALLLTGEGSELARGCGAGALVAVAFADRYSEAIFLGPLALFALRGGGGRSRSARLGGAAGLGLGFALGASLTVGLGDLALWGKPFASLAAFARYTLWEGRSSSQAPHQPPLWYLTRFYLWLPPAALPFLLPLRRRAGGLALPWLGAALPLLLLSLVHHKELRYLQGIVPFLAILLAAGAAAMWRRGWRRSTAALLAVSLLLSLNTARGVIGRKSYAAVAAARALRARPEVRTVALSQVWAYGDRLFFARDVTVLNLSTPPLPGEIAAALPRADAVCLFAADLAQAPATARAIGRAGLVAAGDFRRWYSKPVECFLRRGSP